MGLPAFPEYGDQEALLWLLFMGEGRCPLITTFSYGQRSKSIDLSELLQKNKKIVEKVLTIETIRRILCKQS